MTSDSNSTALPPILCVRGPSRSGKTSLATRIIKTLEDQGIRVGYIKRSHHVLDLPEKSSGRIWQAAPTAMLLRTPERTQLTVAVADEALSSLAAALPPGLDLVLVETHAVEPYPTVLSALLEPDPGEQVVGRWTLDTLDSDAAAAATRAAQLVAADRELGRVIRRAAAFHGGHACAGLVLGTRLALFGAELLGIDVPDGSKRLVVVLETDRCAADAVQAVTGCRPGRRTLRFLDYGKLAATFIDTRAERAIRVSARPWLREQANATALPGEDRHDAQRRAYTSWALPQLFAATGASAAIDQFDRPGPPGRRSSCETCGEEVSDGRDVVTEVGVRCRPCAGQVHLWNGRG
ncbi:MAG: molybdopterin-guanine dinucleotide biosynthesis protein MobB [Dehalococcoidia bacterium]